MDCEKVEGSLSEVGTLQRWECQGMWGGGREGMVGVTIKASGQVQM